MNFENYGKYSILFCTQNLCTEKTGYASVNNNNNIYKHKLYAKVKFTRKKNAFKTVASRKTMDWFSEFLKLGLVHI